MSSVQYTTAMVLLLLPDEISLVNKNSGDMAVHLPRNSCENIQPCSADIFTVNSIHYEWFVTAAE